MSVSPSAVPASPACLITPPPSTDILPKDPQCTDITVFFLPPGVSSPHVAASSTAKTSGKTRERKLGPNNKLPPPPVRSRKIIQMQPVFLKPAGEGIAKDQQPSARKRSAAASANRKTARKIAHSAIERRRRSKMNEEFDALKLLVPACKVALETQGEASLHKLGILQATVEYLRYLETCVVDLQSKLNTVPNELKIDFDLTPPLSSVDQCVNEFDQDEDDEDDQESHESSFATYDMQDIEEEGKEVSRTLLMLRQVNDSSVSSISCQPAGRAGLRVSDLLG
ncbi:hypothetical protein V1514DRAFT_328916 [Lipomyces japonicus]|uniref:uncharacterized protein n=1 Tax=Lipomyces japonicus TaxID=56871 RepID=UPI0034CF4A4F